ncbi:MAG: 16S rRNA (cytidine(1402)-2'-O)-methyltransferase [Oscillospiraceae bacterium]|nr:16S rRNA (cytidine(1402)-2'-O)-methyltransferase [Oscillospiraceae bacterium]MBQ9906898.1 16S rRNA (cytidine(1402)-2'-O)-methyltransferase [Oscillospiraceae bacterium]
MSGTLFIVGTPIGNLGDMTERQLEILGTVDFIAAEDTRVTRKLLSHFDIHTPLVSYHEHSPETVIRQIMDRMTAGERCACVTDAGMPCISDPGAILVQRCIEEHIPMQVIPGPSAVISALAISGQDTTRFCFEGFLSVTKKQRFSHLESLKHEPRTMVFYEAPHKLLNTLKDMLDFFGDRSVSVCRELTKIHEEMTKTTLAEAVSYYEANPPRGEFVLVIAGEQHSETEEKPSLDAVLAIARERIAAGERAADVCKQLAAETGYQKRVLYQAVITD